MAGRPWNTCLPSPCLQWCTSCDCSSQSLSSHFQTSGAHFREKKSEMGQTEKRKKISHYANAGQRAKRRILVVENNNNVQSVLSWLLFSMGFEVQSGRQPRTMVFRLVQGSWPTMCLLIFQLPTPVPVGLWWPVS
jgi:hypothetical protein